MILKTDLEFLEQAAYSLRAISHPTRLCIIKVLTNEEELTVSQLIEALTCEQSLLSHHLTDMRAKGILNCRKEGKNCFYSLKNKSIANILQCVCECHDIKK